MNHEWTVCPRCNSAHWLGWGDCRTCGYDWSKISSARLEFRNRMREYEKRAKEYKGHENSN